MARECQALGDKEEALRLMSDASSQMDGRCSHVIEWITLFQCVGNYAFLLDEDEPEKSLDYYHKALEIARDQLLEELPDALKEIYRGILKADTSQEDRLLRRYVKAADKLSALIKCIEEESAGNTEFKTAKISTEESLKEMIPEIPEINDFITEFLSSYGSTLDELLSRH